MQSIIREVMRFGLVGGMATAVHMVTAFFTVAIVSPYVANVAGYLTAVSVSYVGHHYFTFAPTKAANPAISDLKVSRHRGQNARLLRFVILSLSALALSQIILFLLKSLGFPDKVGLILAIGIIPAYTFLLSRIWVFSNN